MRQAGRRLADRLGLHVPAYVAEGGGGKAQASTGDQHHGVDQGVDADAYRNVTRYSAFHRRRQDVDVVGIDQRDH